MAMSSRSIGGFSQASLAALREANAELREAQADLRAYPAPRPAIRAEVAQAVGLGGWTCGGFVFGCGWVGGLRKWEFKPWKAYEMMIGSNGAGKARNDICAALGDEFGRTTTQRRQTSSGNRDPFCRKDLNVEAPKVPEYLAPAQEQGAIMIGVTGYPGRKHVCSMCSRSVGQFGACLSRVCLAFFCMALT